MTRRRLVADVGGTWSRFAVSDGPGRLADVRNYPTAGRSSFAETMSDYVADIGAPPIQAWCAGVHIAAAGPVDAGVVQLTNSTWQIAAANLSQQLGGVPVHLVNDLEAVGLLLPHLTSADLRPIGAATRGGLVGNRIAINVGTGFGAATAIRTGDCWAVVGGEAGHMSLAGTTPEEAVALAGVRSIEDVLSGAGVLRLYATLAREGGADDGATLETSIFSRTESDAAAAATVRMMSQVLGRICGDLVLATAAWDGIYLCGSVAKAWCEVGDASAFRSAFDDKGPMRARMAQVPAHVIVTADPALLGLTYPAA